VVEATRKRPFSSVVWRRRRQYDPYDQNDPYGYDPYDPRNRPRGGYYQPARGSSCLRDACLFDAGCCIGESLDGNCLVLTLLAVPQLVIALAGGARPEARSRPTGGAGAGMIAAVRVYQREISAHRPATCRFSPTCSEYAAEALHAHGAVRGSLLTLRRLVRCRPGGRRGHDPVPR
jgi:putative membrane protein insertion efficiency factor